MRRDTAGGKKHRYRSFLKSLFLGISCFTLLYFFVFTESYSKFQKTDAILEIPIAEKAAASSMKQTTKWTTKRTPKQTADGKTMLLPCGIPVGIYMETKGVLVTEITDVMVEKGRLIQPVSGQIEVGDYIVEADGREIRSKEAFRDVIKNSGGKPVKLAVEHNGKKKHVMIQPVLAESGDYMAGIWIRDNMHGIGTLTWLDKEENFAALGHCISDIDTGKLFKIDQGQLYHAEIYSLIKGSKNQPGSLAGAIDYRLSSRIGMVDRNTEQGVFGTGNETICSLAVERLGDYYKADTFEALWKKAALETALQKEIKDGKAQMLSCFSGEYRLYDIEIQKIGNDEKDYENVNLEITITDSSLLKQTGGILQGMSGSPILQNGKLIGAVTHVLVNDPTKGYGIFIENMLDAAA